MKRVVFTIKQITEAANPVYMMACELKKQGAPIEFNLFNVDLSVKDIVIKGKIADRIKMDGSHEFIFKEIEE